jgi:hypothetical protein
MYTGEIFSGTDRDDEVAGGSTVLMLPGLTCHFSEVNGISFRCFGGGKRHIGPLRVCFVFSVSFLPELFVATDVVNLSLLREYAVN